MVLQVISFCGVKTVCGSIAVWGSPSGGDEPGTKSPKASESKRDVRQLREFQSLE